MLQGLVLFHFSPPTQCPTCMYIGKHSIFLFASFVFNNYNFLKASKAGVSVVIVIVVNSCDATKNSEDLFTEVFVPSQDTHMDS